MIFSTSAPLNRPLLPANYWNLFFLCHDRQRRCKEKTNFVSCSIFFAIYEFPSIKPWLGKCDTEGNLKEPQRGPVSIRILKISFWIQIRNGNLSLLLPLVEWGALDPWRQVPFLTITFFDKKRLWISHVYKKTNWDIFWNQWVSEDVRMGLNTIRRSFSTSWLPCNPFSGQPQFPCAVVRNGWIASVTLGIRYSNLSARSQLVLWAQKLLVFKNHGFGTKTWSKIDSCSPIFGKGAHQPCSLRSAGQSWLPQSSDSTGAPGIEQTH